MINENIFGCPFAIGGDGRLYYDDNLKLYAYDFKKESIEKIVDFSDLEKYRTEDNGPVYHYVVGKNKIIVKQSGTTLGAYVSYYDFRGGLIKKELIKFPQWETNEYARNFAY